MKSLKFLQITIFLALFSSSLIQAAKPSRKLDENPPDLENKCGDCPCDNPCNPTPSPPPPSPSPPPPSPSPPPPTYPTTPTNNCPPPPAVPSGGGGGGGGGGGPKPPKGPNPPYIYINGPPGSVYPVVSYYSGSRRSFLVGKIPFLIGCVVWAVAF